MFVFLADMVISLAVAYTAGKLVQKLFTPPSTERLTEKEMMRRLADAYDERKPEDRF